MVETVIDSDGEVTITGTVLNSGKSPISGRIYREEDLKHMVDEFNARGDAARIGEMMNADSTDYGVAIDMSKATHRVERLWFEDGAIMAEMKVLKRKPQGSMLHELITGQGKIGVATVGYKPTPVMTGLIEEIEGEKVVTDVTLIRVDVIPEIPDIGEEY